MEGKKDEDLVKNIQKGDIFSFKFLVLRYQKPLFVFVNRIIIDPYLCEEIVQDTLFKVYQTIDRVNTQLKFSTYIFSIAKNKAISRLRSLRKNISLSEIEILVDESLYEKLTQEESRKKIKKAMRELKPKYNQTLRLYYFDELSYKEIGKKLKLPLNTVRTFLKRGKVKLSQILDKE